MQRTIAAASIAILACCSAPCAALAAPQPLDNDFLVKAAACENTEIQISKLAADRAASPQVKEFAAQMVQDHQKCSDKLAGVVKDRKVAIVSGLEKRKSSESRSAQQVEWRGIRSGLPCLRHRLLAKSRSRCAKHKRKTANSPMFAPSPTMPFRNSGSISNVPRNWPRP